MVEEAYHQKSCGMMAGVSRASTGKSALLLGWDAGSGPLSMSPQPWRAVVSVDS